MNIQSQSLYLLWGCIQCSPPKVKHQWTYIEQLMFLRSTFIATCINYLLIAPFYAPETFEFNEEKNVDESATGERGERKLEVKSVYTKNSDLHISLRICASEYRLADVKCRKFSKRTLYSSCAFELCTNHCLSLYACGSILKTSLTWMWAIAGGKSEAFCKHVFINSLRSLSLFSLSWEYAYFLIQTLCCFAMFDVCNWMPRCAEQQFWRVYFSAEKYWTLANSSKSNLICRLCKPPPMFHCSTNFFLCGSGSRPSYSQQQRMEIYVYFFGIFSMSFHCISSFIKCHQFLLQCASCLLFFLLTSSISFCSGSFSFPLLFTVSKSRLSAFN